MAASGRARRGPAGAPARLRGRARESVAAVADDSFVEVEGETHELTGSAEAQYSKWRSLLRSIYLSETGLTGAED